MNKKNYNSPAIRVVFLLQQQHLLAGSGLPSASPSADYMKDPGFSENEDVGTIY